MVSKMIVCLVLAALVGCAFAQLVPIAGTRDLTGGYLDHYTGQYSSALTGRVYNTAPVVAAPAYAAPVLAHHAVLPAAYPAQVAWIRR